MRLAAASEPGPAEGEPKCHRVGTKLADHFARLLTCRTVPGGVMGRIVAGDCLLCARQSDSVDSHSRDGRVDSIARFSMASARNGLSRLDAVRHPPSTGDRHYPNAGSSRISRVALLAGAERAHSGSDQADHRAGCVAAAAIHDTGTLRARSRADDGCPAYSRPETSATCRAAAAFSTGTACCSPPIRGDGG